MTHDEAMAQFTRLMKMAIAPPDPDAVFAEWYRAFEQTPAEDMDAALTRYFATKSDRFWPAIGELRSYVSGVQSGRETSQGRRCASCEGSSWVDAPPFRANGGHLYACVRRCPACGVPAPNMEYQRGQQTPLSPSELREWAQARSRQGGPTTRAEFLAEMAAIVTRMKMPKATLRLVED